MNVQQHFRHVSVTDSPDMGKREMSAEIYFETAKFLADGGRIKRIPPGVSGMPDDFCQYNLFVCSRCGQRNKKAAKIGESLCEDCAD